MNYIQQDQNIHRRTLVYMKGVAITSKQNNNVQLGFKTTSTTKFFLLFISTLEYKIENTPLSRNRSSMIKAKGRCILGLGWKPFLPKLVVQLVSNLFMHLAWDLEHGPQPKVVVKQFFYTISTTLKKNFKLQMNKK